MVVPLRQLRKTSSILFSAANFLSVARVATAAGSGADDMVAPYPFSATLSADGLTDTKFPGTAVDRLRAVTGRVLTLDEAADLSGDFSKIRRRLLCKERLRYFFPGFLE